MSSLIEITATFKGTRFRFANADGDVIIGDATPVNGSVDSPDLIAGNNLVTIKGQADVDELEHHQTYRFYGRWANYKNKRTGQTERQFHFQTFTQSAPHGRAGIISYLKKAGEGRGIGHARATKLWEVFGSDAVRKLREHPEECAAVVKGLSTEQATAASSWLTERQKLEDCTIEVTNLLAGRGFPKATTRKAIREWGNLAAKVIRRDPYALMNFRGCGFKRCDALYLELGLDPARLRRQAFCVWYSIASNSDGHTWFPVEYAVRGLRQHVGSDARPGPAIRMAKRIGRLSLDRNGAIAVAREFNGALVETEGKVWIAEGRKAWNESRIAQMISGHAEAEATMHATGHHGDFWPNPDSIEAVDDHQKEVLSQALRGPICILGGGPGTGKTYSAAAVVKVMAATIGIGNIIVGAPTGKAAVRITESLQQYGLNLQARTWHSLLGVGKPDEDSGAWGFRHNESNPWNAKLVIGDEMSMTDTDLMCSVMRAIPAGCRFLLVGDINQLPPVGHGAPLRDMIAAGVPHGELTEIKRNSGGIVEACAAIREEKPWVHRLDAGNSWTNLQHAEHRRPEDQIKTMLGIIRLQRERGVDPVWDCQVLVAVNDKSPLARKAINKILQGELNSNPPGDGSPFRVDDKVVNTRNGYFKSLQKSDKASPDPDVEQNDDGEVYVANGELGRVVQVEDKYIVVSLTSPDRVVMVPRGKANDGEQESDGESKTSTGCSFDLGYALSCHKSQGSEWKTVIVLLDEYPGARRICTREWLYTAISRAKANCYLVGQKQIAESMCRRTAIDKRKTFLRERIHLQNVELELAAI